MQIDIFQDTVCPWCRIGKKNLTEALKQWGAEDVTIRYRTFFLNDSLPPEGADFRQYMVAKGAGAIPLEQFFDGPRQAGARVGLTFNFETITQAPNTLLSHRLIALTPDDQKEPMIDAIYKAYFEDGRDIGKLDVLLEIAAELGLDRNATEEKLRSDAVEQDVLADVEWARQAGITGVPFFVFNDKYAMSGAQPVEAMLRTLNKVAQLSQQEGVR